MTVNATTSGCKMNWLRVPAEPSRTVQCSLSHRTVRHMFIHVLLYCFVSMKNFSGESDLGTCKKDLLPCAVCLVASRRARDYNYSLSHRMLFFVNV